jgi:glycosyl transferase family 25
LRIGEVKMPQWRPEWHSHFTCAFANTGGKLAPCSRVRERMFPAKDQGRGGGQSWPLLIVNLDRSPERWRHAESAYARSGFRVERLAAIDGGMLGEGEIAAAVDLDRNRRLYKHPLTRGEIGCYLSHRLAWRRIASSGAEGGYVFEDDSEPGDMLGAAMALVQGCAGDWDLVKLFTQRPPSGRIVGEAGMLSLRRPAVLPGGTVGYALSRRGADKLLGRAERFFRPLDIDLKHWWEQDLRVLVISPGVVRSARLDAEASTIEPQRRHAKRSRFVRFVFNARYQARFRLALYLRQLRGRLIDAAPDRRSVDP